MEIFISLNNILKERIIIWHIMKLSLNIFQFISQCAFDSVYLLSSPLLIKTAVMLWLWSRVTQTSTSTISKERLHATVVIKALEAGICPLEDWLQKIRCSGMVLMTCLLRRVSVARLLLCKLLLHRNLKYQYSVV